jgi:hypothetical protein
MLEEGARTEQDICRQSVSMNDVPGARCSNPRCHHTNLVHTDGECALCRMEFLNTRLEVLVERYETLLTESLRL